MADTREPGYGEAMAELETIVRGMEQEDIEVEALTEKVKRARYLIGLCKGKLKATERDVMKVLSEMNEPPTAEPEEAEPVKPRPAAPQARPSRPPADSGGPELF